MAEDKKTTEEQPAAEATEAEAKDTKAPAGKAVDDKSPADKAPAEKAPAEKAPAAKGPAEKAAAAKSTTAKPASGKSAVGKVSAEKAAAGKTAVAKAGAEEAPATEASDVKAPDSKVTAVGSIGAAAADKLAKLAADARYRGTGKRKAAIARVILKPGKGVYTINGRTLENYFPRPTLLVTAREPLAAVGYEERMDVVARIHGGGVAAQAGALRHGISRALLEVDEELRGDLKRRGFLTRDARVKERKKAGLKKARKRPQFSKR